MVTKKKENILETSKPKSIVLADGNEYTLPPIDLTTLANLEKSLGFGTAQLQEKLESETMITLRALIFGLLRENYPDMEIEKMGRLITPKEISTMVITISEILAVG